MFGHEGTPPYQQSFSLSGKGGQASATQSWHCMHLKRQLSVWRWQEWIVWRECTYVWWPRLDKDVEDPVRTCSQCQANQLERPAAALHPWSRPTRPWSRLHVDYAGPLYGHMFLVVIDVHSKWIEAFCVSSTTSSITIEKLRMLFAQMDCQKPLSQIMNHVLSARNLNHSCSLAASSILSQPLTSFIKWIGWASSAGT